MSLEQQVRNYLKEVLEKEYFLVDIILQKLKKKSKLIILLDGDKGINIGVCSQVTKKLNSFLDEKSILQDAYTLEVSSAGADTPLKIKRQYPQHIGRKLSINTKDNIKLEGKLQEVTEKGIFILEDKAKDKKEIFWENIQEAKVLISFK